MSAAAWQDGPGSGHRKTVTARGYLLDIRPVSTGEVSLFAPCMPTLLTPREALELGAELMQAALAIGGGWQQHIPVPETHDSNFGEFEAARREAMS